MMSNLRDLNPEDLAASFVGVRALGLVDVIPPIFLSGVGIEVPGAHPLGASEDDLESWSKISQLLSICGEVIGIMAARPDRNQPIGEAEPPAVQGPPTWKEAAPAPADTDAAVDATGGWEAFDLERNVAGALRLHGDGKPFKARNIHKQIQIDGDVNPCGDQCTGNRKSCKIAEVLATFAAHPDVPLTSTPARGPYGPVYRYQP